MAGRSTIGANPLDAVVPDPLVASKTRQRGPAPAGRVEKERLTVHVPVDLIDRVKNAAYWTPGLTLAGLAEEALKKAVGVLEKERGGPYPPRREELKGGRPLK